MSVNTDESFAVVEEVSSCKGDSVIHNARFDEPVVSQKPNVVSIGNNSAVKRLAGPEQARYGTVFVATSCVVGAPVLSGDASKDGDDSPITQESATVLEVVDAE